LDIAVLGYQPLAQEQEADLNDAFVNSDLPFKVYIVIWSRTSEKFKSIISQSHQVLQAPQ
jgi:hypothetical protein